MTPYLPFRWFSISHHDPSKPSHVPSVRRALGGVIGASEAPSTRDHPLRALSPQRPGGPPRAKCCRCRGCPTREKAAGGQAPGPGRQQREAEKPEPANQPGRAGARTQADEPNAAKHTRRGKRGTQAASPRRQPGTRPAPAQGGPRPTSRQERARSPKERTAREADYPPRAGAPSHSRLSTTPRCRPGRPRSPRAGAAWETRRLRSGGRAKTGGGAARPA